MLVADQSSSSGMRTAFQTLCYRLVQPSHDAVEAKAAPHCCPQILQLGKIMQLGDELAPGAEFVYFDVVEMRNFLLVWLNHVAAV